MYHIGHLVAPDQVPEALGEVVIFHNNRTLSCDISLFSEFCGQSSREHIICFKSHWPSGDSRTGSGSPGEIGHFSITPETYRATYHCPQNFVYNPEEDISSFLDHIGHLVAPDQVLEALGVMVNFSQQQNPIKRHITVLKIV